MEIMLCNGSNHTNWWNTHRHAYDHRSTHTNPCKCYACAHLCVCVCVRACVRACVRVCVCFKEGNQRYSPCHTQHHWHSCLGSQSVPCTAPAEKCLSRQNYWSWRTRHAIFQEFKWSRGERSHTQHYLYRGRVDSLCWKSSIMKGSLF